MGRAHGAQLTTEFANLPSGYRPTVLEAYARGSALNHNVVFTQQAGAQWTYYFGKTDAQAQTLFNQYVAQGYRQLSSSVAVVSGVRYNTALYDKSNGGSWVSRNALTYAEYSTLFNDLAAQGYHQSYLDVDSVGGSFQYAVLFDTRAVGSWEVWLDLDATGINNQLLASEGVFRPTRLVHGYASSGTSAFAGLWSASC